jgi:hypothetical protein
MAINSFWPLAVLVCTEALLKQVDLVTDRLGQELLGSGPEHPRQHVMRTKQWYHRHCCGPVKHGAHAMH